MGCNVSSKKLQSQDSETTVWALPRDGIGPGVANSSNTGVTFSKVAECQVSQAEDDLLEVENRNKKRKEDLPAVRRPLQPIISSGNAQEAPQFIRSPNKSPKNNDTIPGTVELKSIEKRPPVRVIDDEQIKEASILAETRKNFDPAKYQKIQSPVRTWESPTPPRFRTIQSVVRDSPVRAIELDEPVFDKRESRDFDDRRDFDNRRDFDDRRDLDRRDFDDKRFNRRDFDRRDVDRRDLDRGNHRTPDPLPSRMVPLQKDNHDELLFHSPAHRDLVFQSFDDKNDMFYNKNMLSGPLEVLSADPYEDLFGEDDEALMREILQEFDDDL